MPELTVVVRAKAKPGREGDLERELRAIVASTHNEPGCLRYVLHRSIEAAGTFLTIERWASKEAIDQHFAMTYVQVLLQKGADLLAAPPEISVYELLPEGRSDKTRI